jgi:hypothetical protein
VILRRVSDLEPGGAPTSRAAFSRQLSFGLSFRVHVRDYVDPSRRRTAPLETPELKLIKPKNSTSS